MRKTLGKWIGIAISPLWRWKWLLLVCLLVTVGYALWSVVKANPNSFFTSDFIITHGWPFEYQVRTIDDNTGWRRWSIWSDITDFSPGAFFVNLSIAVGISVTLTYLAAWRFQRRQFRLMDLLAATGVVGAILGYVLFVENRFQADQRLLGKVWNNYLESGPNRRTADWRLRPFRDLGIISSDALYPTYIDCYIDCGLEPARNPSANQVLIREANLGRQLRHPICSIRIEDESLTDAGIAALAQWAPTCEMLELHPDPALSDNATATIANAWPALKELKFGSPLLGQQSLDSLANLRQLERLALCDVSRELTPEDLHRLDRLPNLRLLGLPGFLFSQISPDEERYWRDQGVTVYESEFQYTANAELGILK